MSRWVTDETAVGSTDAQHLDGVPWYEAPVPRKWHRCKPQTRGYYNLSFVQRCACGATWMRGGWVGKNERSRP
jgi:hypothetical protein